MDDHELEENNVFISSSIIQQSQNVGEVNLSTLLETKYETREDLLKAAKEFYSAQGYSLSIKGSRPNKYVTIGCDRGGVYRDRQHIAIEERQRKTTTRLINCPFQIYGKRQEEGIWKLLIKNESHNHEASKDVTGHPSERVFSKEDILTVDKMSKAGILPRQILSSIRQMNPTTQVIARDVYNMRRKITKENLNGRSIIQVLFEEFGKAGFLFDFKLDQDGSLTHIFFAHPEFIKLSRSYSTIFVMDCTYKTNRYKMPLLEIVGITSFNTSFYSCFAFLRKEGYEDYEWALGVFSEMLGDGICPSVIVTDRELALMKAIQEVFPSASNFLCVWHIEKNIVAKCKSHFERKKDWEDFLSSWNMVVFSTTEEAFGQAWHEVELLCKEKTDMVKYLRNTWLPYKQYFVNAWTGKKLHFGTHASSRVEGAHSKLKRYLLVSTGDILVVKQKICLLLENDIKEIKVKIANERIQVPHRCNIPFFREVVTRLSIFALNELEKQFEKLTNHTMSQTCSGSFIATMGLPCAHMMSCWKGQAIPLASIHSQWRIDTRESIFVDMKDDDNDSIFSGLLNRLEDKYQQLSLVEKKNIHEKLFELVDGEFSLSYEPNIQRSRGRPPIGKKRKGLTSTVRDPSQFEIVEASLKQITHKDGDYYSQTSQSTTTVLNEELISTFMDERGSMNFVDLNANSSSYDEFQWN